MIPGMTMQDWLAGHILAAMIGSDPSNANQRDANGRLCGFDPQRMANMAKSAYQAADAMMAARGQATSQQAPAAARQPVR